MTTPIVPSITEDQLVNLDCCDEYSLRHMHGEVGLLIDSYRALQERLRAAEKGEARYLWLRDRVGVDFAYGDFMPYLPTGGYRLGEQDKKQTDEAIDVALERQL